MSMKISIGLNLQQGPWGGGNQFGNVLTEYLRSKGHEVFFDLKESNLDIILLCEPRKSTKSCAFNQKEILRYLLTKNKNALVVHRINECDERKGTTTVNNQIGNANIVADHTVFISSWLKELYRTQEIRTEHCSVIMNGADSKIFNNTSYSTWNKDTPLKVVTHHWGGNWLKGFDVYEALDKQLNDKNTRKKFEFTFIGNIPKGFSFKNSRYITPLGGLELSKELQRHHVYLTASQFEPAGMHHIEGAMCGLPLLYRNTGGAIPEYCRNFGIEFNEQNFFEKLHEMAEMYDYYTVRMKDYPYTAEKMCHEYLELFNYMNKNREEFLHARIWQKKPLWLMKNLLIGDII